MEQQLDIPKLLELRKVTRIISEELSRQLRDHLAVLAPLFSPKGILGDHVRGGPRLASKSADNAFQELTQLYQSVCSSKPFNLRKSFDSPLDLMSTSPEVTPSDYRYTAQTGDGRKSLTITSPLKWILTYKGYGPQRCRELLGRQKEAVGSELQDLVLHQLVLHVTMKRRPGVAQLLGALRFPVTFERLEEFGPLPVAVVTCPVATFRPQDDVVIQSTEISGTPAFEEIVNLDDIAEMRDPLKMRLTELVQGQGMEL